MALDGPRRMPPFGCLLVERLGTHSCATTEQLGLLQPGLQSRQPASRACILLGRRSYVCHRGQPRFCNQGLKAGSWRMCSHPAQVKAVAAAQALRKPHWFEKFHWFLTSENALVLSGRDAQQNELLVKRYLRKDDLYVHADLHGAATTILRVEPPGAPGGWM